jgi:hypothetical protein
VLMLNCPTSGREFSTGIQIEEDCFSKLPDTVTKARCPHCGLEHAWWTREARIAEAIPSGQWVEALDRPR